MAIVPCVTLLPSLHAGNWRTSLEEEKHFFAKKNMVWHEVFVLKYNNKMCKILTKKQWQPLSCVSMNYVYIESVLDIP